MLPSEEIKDRINIVDLIGEYVPLKKAGANHRGLCPFHQEKTPSFMVSPSKQIWHCFGCGLGGDIFEFVKQMESVEFPEALQILASRAGITLERPTASYQAEVDEKKVLYDLNHWAALFYAKILQESPVAEPARAYLRNRGFQPETIKKWMLGYAPADYHSLENFLVKKGYQRTEGVAAGLLSEKDGGFFDRFRDRVCFPLHDIHGRVVGFTARILDSSRPDLASGQAKYINTPETAIYHKSRLIYGLHLAKSEIRKTGQAVVVEGNTDVITCHEAGFSNVIGSSGTAFTESQLESLKRFTDNLTFAFDVDEAGLLATRRAVELALSFGFNVKIVSLPKALAKDPDELIRKDRQMWEQRVAEAQSFLDFYFESIFAKLNPEEVLDKKQAVKDLLPLLKLLPDPIDRAHYVQKLSDRLGLDQKIILDLLNRQLQKKDQISNYRSVHRQPVERKSRQVLLETRVLGLLLKYASELAADWQNLQDQDFSTPVFREIYAAVQGQAAAGQFNLQNFIAGNPKLAPEINLLVFALENELSMATDWNLDDLKKQFLTNLKQGSLKRKMEDLSFRIKTAEAAGLVTEAKNLSSEFTSLTRELNKYHAG